MAKRPWVRCCVPGCSKGALQRERSRALSVFRVPRDAATRELWERRLEMTPGSLRTDSQLCELHFEPSQICRDYVHHIGGKEVRIPRGRAALLPGALPLAPPHGEEHPDPKRPGSELNSIKEHVHKLSAIHLPSKYWSCIRCHNLEGAVFATSSFNPATNDLITEKMVVVQWAPNERRETLVCETFVHGRRLGDVIVGDLCVVQQALCMLDALQLCSGVGSIEYVLEQLGGRLTAHLEHSLVAHKGTYFSHACVATVEAVGASCASCKLARKAVLTKKSALLRKNFLVSYVDSSAETK